MSSRATPPAQAASVSAPTASAAAKTPSTARVALESDPQWYKDAVIYELHVRAFADHDGDGIGDFRGLTEKLDYLQDLGVTAIWLLPFYPSPLKDDGYDISEYTNVHPSYGTLRDFKQFLREAHRRGLRVITELVINHTSDQHEWFQRARRAAPGSRAREFYVWSDTPERYQEARIIFKDFETSNWTWDPVAKAYYWHRFYSHQPDLNFDSPQVRKAIFQVLDFWLEMGVDGLRLDAVPYLVERDGTNCENLPETHAFLKELRRHVDRSFKNRMFLAEANQWPEDASAYFGEGDECHTAFHFPLMPRLFMATRLEDRYPIIEILQQTPDIPALCQWMIFLRNHDELTLEMVTDQERDYMYRVYASDAQMRINLGIRRRLAPLLWNNRRKIELMNGLLFSLPGTPVLYYGDEMGMGDNVYLGDRNGVRTPMQWSGDRNAGFSRTNPQRLFLPVTVDPEYHYEAVNVEAQQNNPSSMLWWMKRMIALRKRYHSFGRGSLEFLYPENRKVLSFIRRLGDEIILVVANLSRFTQCAELDLSAFKGMVPMELFGQTPFPPIGELPYFITMGPHNFYWFSLEPAGDRDAGARAAKVPSIHVDGEWRDAFAPRRRARGELERALPRYLMSCRWFGGKARAIRSVKILETVELSEAASMVLVQVDYADAEAEVYQLPVTFVPDGNGAPPQEAPGAGVIARLLTRTDEGGEAAGALCDATQRNDVLALLFDAIGRRRQFKGVSGRLSAAPTSVLRRRGEDGDGSVAPSVLRGEQSNTSIKYGERFIMKLFRRLDQGMNPDVEIGRFLTERCRFPHIPPMAGSIEYRQPRREPVTVALLQGFVPNEGDAWRFTLDELEGYFERALANADESPEMPAETGLLALAETAVPDRASELIGPYLQMAQLLATRTAELHLALASDDQDPAFAPEPFSSLYQRSLYQSMRSQTNQSFSLLKKRLPKIPAEIRDEAKAVLAREPEVLQAFRRLLGKKLSAQRIRCHGDYHLGQVLYTGKDFIIIDFEGEPAHSISERRLKRSPLRDVAGMIRSFHYAAFTHPLSYSTAPGSSATSARPADRTAMEAWAQVWFTWVSAAFLRTYLDVAGQGAFLPKAGEEVRTLLDTHLLEKAVYELSYELNNRPDWVRIPLRGIAHLLAKADG